MNFKSQYKLGRRVGKFFVYNVDGSVLVFGNYVDDKRHGIWRFYEESGKLLTEINYNYGIPENLDELEKIETDKLQKLEEKRNTIDDPGNFIENPEQYIEKVFQMTRLRAENTLTLMKSHPWDFLMVVSPV